MGSLNEVQFMKNGKMDKNVDFLASDIPLVEKTGGHQISTTSLFCTYP